MSTLQNNLSSRPVLKTKKKCMISKNQPYLLPTDSSAFLPGHSWAPANPATHLALRPALAQGTPLCQPLVDPTDLS